MYAKKYFSSRETRVRFEKPFILVWDVDATAKLDAFISSSSVASQRVPQEEKRE